MSLPLRTLIAFALIGTGWIILWWILVTHLG